MPAGTPITTAQAAEELLRRRQARRKLIPFIKYTFPQYIDEPAHHLMGDTLDKVISGEINRLMIFAPPQHGKSQMVSCHLPAFWLGVRPNDPIILSSYGASLAEDKGRQARDLVEGEAYRRLFPGISTYRSSRSVQMWRLQDKRGYMLSVGVGGPVTGRGAMLGIIDDPFENWEQAQSETHRNKVWDWYRSTFRTRVWEGGAIVLIMTRWSEDDIAGRLLAEQADKWHVLRLPAMAETQEDRDSNNEFLGLPVGQADPLGRLPGDPLCPARFSRKALEELKADVGTMAWSAEYQGVPRPPEGNFFKRHWFRVVRTAPEGDIVFRVRYWDNAATEDDGCYTCGTLLALAKDNQVYVEDVVRGQWSSRQRNDVMLQTAQTDAARYNTGACVVNIWFEHEGGSSGKDAADALLTLLSGFPVRADKVSGSKLVRAQPFQAKAEAKLVHLVAGKWNKDWLEELTSFPNGKYKDQVDSVSGAYNRLPRYMNLPGKMMY
jgi:predicted phage terminase large subunit-like protein